MSPASVCSCQISDWQWSTPLQCSQHGNDCSAAWPMLCRSACESIVCCLASRTGWVLSLEICWGLSRLRRCFLFHFVMLMGTSCGAGTFFFQSSTYCASMVREAGLDVAFELAQTQFAPRHTPRQREYFGHASTSRAVLWTVSMTVMTYVHWLTGFVLCWSMEYKSCTLLYHENKIVKQILQVWRGASCIVTRHVQSNVTYPDATYPSTSDIRQWGVLYNFDSLTYKIWS